MIRASQVTINKILSEQTARHASATDVYLTLRNMERIYAHTRPRVCLCVCVRVCVCVCLSVYCLKID